MFQYSLETLIAKLAMTTLLLCWCFALAWAWSRVAYSWLTARHSHQQLCDDSTQGAARALRPSLMMPALVIAPLLLLAAFRGFEVNLLFPVHFFADTSTLIAAGIAPALVLLLASGLVGQLTRTIASEYAYWRCKPFATVALAVGRNPRRDLRKLVLLKASVASWSRCLPWLFGELVVVEAVFNAPGIGLEAWHLARTRNFAALAMALCWLVALYAFCTLAAAYAHRWIGRRLESYA